MKKIKTAKIVTLIFFWLFLFCVNNVHAEVIHTFDVNLIISKDSSILVTETIKYDFGALEKHGIYRDIPIKSEIYNNKNLFDFELENVLMDGVNEKYTVNQIGSNKNIKIGKSDVLIKGEHTYVISYKIKGVINYFKDFDELYWNIIGNSWNIPIENYTLTVKLPEGTDMSKIQKSCYIGVLGSKEICNLNIVNDSIVSTFPRLLNQNEGVAIAIGFPKGIVSKPLKFTLIISFIKNNIILILPIIVFIIMFFVWRKYGKDPKGYSTIIPQYEPPVGMKPTLAGSLIDEKVGSNDIIAGLIYLANIGYLKINRLNKNWFLGNYDYEIILLNNDISVLEKTEISLLSLFFNELNVGNTIKISEFKKDLTFMTKIKSIKNDIYKEMTERKYYEKNPNTVKLPYFIIALIFVRIVSFIIGGSNIVVFISILVSAIIIVVFGTLMSKKTKLGAEIKDHILGFKIFLSVTEKDRINFHNSPNNKNPEKFMEFLPYAIALGVEKDWAKQFGNISIHYPSWYGGAIVGNFVISDFISDMSMFSSSLGSVISGSSGIGGMGSSGGGGGGGGGGSW